MKKIRAFALLLVLLGGLGSTSRSVTVEWAIPPTSPYYGLQWVYPGLYNFYKTVYDAENHKNYSYEGFIDIDGNIIYQTYAGEFYYHFLGGGILLVTNIDEDSNQEIKGLLYLNDMHFKPFPAGYYPRYKYFTEGLICVQNKEGRVGYIDSNGQEIIKCQFLEGEPFRNALAFVRDEKGQTMYITRDWDVSHKPLKIKAGRVEGYSFFNGHTLVRNKKNRLVKIGTDGKVVETTKSAYMEYDPAPYKEVNIRRWERAENPHLKSDSRERRPNNMDRINSEDMLYGYSREGRIVVPMQFSEAEDFDGDYAVVTLNGLDRHAGLLHLIEGDYQELGMDSLLTIDDTNQSVSALKGTFAYPATVDPSRLRMMFIHPDSNELTDVTDCKFTNGKAEFVIQLDSIPELNEFDLWYGLYYEPSLLVWDNTRTVSVVQAMTPTIISIKTTDYGADSGNHQLVWAHINNPTRETVKATMKLIGERNGEHQVTKDIKPGENTTIEMSALVTKAEDAEVRVSLDNGDSKYRLVRLQPHQSSSPKTVQRRVIPTQPPKPVKQPEPKVHALPRL